MLQIKSKDIVFYSDTHKYNGELMLYLSTFLQCNCIFWVGNSCYIKKNIYICGVLL